MIEIHPDYGPAAAYSEHKVGDRIIYTQVNETFTGEILWVAAASERRGKPIGQHYIVAPDRVSGFVDIVFTGDVLVT